MGKETRSQHFADFCHPKKRIGKIAIVFLTCYAMLAVVVLNITTQNAMAQMETCPNGYYLATNNLCYPYQQPTTNSSAQIQQGQVQPLTPQEIQNCKIEKDSLALDKALGANASQTVALGRLLNDTCGSIGDR